MYGEGNVIRRYSFCFVIVIAVLLPCTNAWFFRHGNRFSLKVIKPLNAEASVLENHSKNLQEEDFQFYNFSGAKVSYRKYNAGHRSSTQQQRPTTTLLLIHPIGIGQASWFWDRFISHWRNSSTAGDSNYIIYTVNLLGCGVTSEKNALWNMTEKTQQHTSLEASHFPTSLPLMLWVEQCESMLNHVICSNQRATIEHVRSTNHNLSNDRWHLVKTIVKRNTLNQDQQELLESKVIHNIKVTIVAQGGLAPVAVLLAARNPSLIKHMILTSPPTYNDLTKSIPESALRFNYNALCNPFLEKIVFGVLESRWAIQFFSNLFLFNQPCDSEWISKTMEEAGPDVRTSVQLFNAGYCFYRSYQVECSNMIQQPTLILRGNDDNRDYKSFQNTLNNCTTLKINGKNVLPWESPIECCTAIKKFIVENDL